MMACACVSDHTPPALVLLLSLVPPPGRARVVPTPPRPGRLCMILAPVGGGTTVRNKSHSSTVATVLAVRTSPNDS